MIDYAIANITKRKSRSIITVIGISVLIALVIVISGIVSYQKRTMNAHASAGGAGRIIVQTFTAGMNYPAMAVNMKEQMADSLLTFPQIQSNISSKVLFYEIEPPPYPNNPPALLLTGLVAGKEKAFMGSIVMDTRCIAGKAYFNTTNGKEAILGFKAFQNLEKNLNRTIKIGDSIEILKQKFHVTGILEKSPDLVVNHSIIIPLEVSQNLLQKSGLVTSVILYPFKISEKDKVIASIKKMVPKASIISPETMARNAASGIKLFEKLITSINMVVIIAAIILISTVMSVTIKERTREIGVLRAIGASNKIIVNSILWEIFILSLTGCILGSIVAGFILKYGLLENIFSIKLIIRYIPMSIVLTIISGIIPVIRIFRIQPVDSLRYE
jgi:putative ABC transport system permease protein